MFPFVRHKNCKPLTKEREKLMAETLEKIDGPPSGYTNAAEEEKWTQPDMFKD